jgi:hypothetical protein
LATIEHSGREQLESGDVVWFPNYSIRFEDSPAEYGLLDEFEALYGEQLPDVEDVSDYGSLEKRKRLRTAVATLDYVEDAIVHQNSVARWRDLDPQDEEDLSCLREERLEAQGIGYSLSLSDVWQTELEGERVGTCKERAMTLHAMFQEMGIDSEFHNGKYRGEGYEDDPAGHAWVQVDDFIADPSSVGGLFHWNTDKFQDDYRNTGLLLN